MSSTSGKWGFDAGRKGDEPKPRSEKAGPVEGMLFGVTDKDAKRGHDDYVEGYNAGATQRVADELKANRGKK